MSIGGSGLGLRDVAVPALGVLLLIAGVGYTFQYPGLMAPPVLAMVGGFVILLGWVQLVGTVNRSGLGPLVYQRLGPRDVLLMWASASGKMYPIVAKETVYERYLNLPFFGKLRIPRGSMMVLPTGRKIGIAVAGVSHVVPPQQARVAMELKELGFKDFQDVETFVVNYPLFRAWLESLTEAEKEEIRDKGALYLEELRREVALAQARLAQAQAEQAQAGPPAGGRGEEGGGEGEAPVEER